MADVLFLGWMFCSGPESLEGEEVLREDGPVSQRPVSCPWCAELEDLPETFGVGRAGAQEE